MATPRTTKQRRVAIVALLLVAGGRSNALAWGCDGHRAVALIAERLLAPATLTLVRAVLTASPVDPALKRGCEPVPSDIVADVASWADDQRAADPATGGWHFVNFPRSIGSNTASAAKYCPAGNCIVDAMAAQFQVLKTSIDSRRRANALRFVIHLAGDIHQPLHAITNGDRGGNCFPVAYRAQPPQEDERGNFSPNLHGVWDYNSIATLMKARGLADARALADYVAGQGALPAVAPAAATRARVTSWARDANALARSVAYGRLQVPAPIEPSSAITLSSCRDNHDVGHRLLALNERIGETYEQASAPVIVAQLRLAGLRLAAVLKSAFPLR